MPMVASGLAQRCQPCAPSCSNSSSSSASSTGGWQRSISSRAQRPGSKRAVTAAAAPACGVQRAAYHSAAPLLPSLPQRRRGVAARVSPGRTGTGGNGQPEDPWAASNGAGGPAGGPTENAGTNGSGPGYENTDWGWSNAEDWDPAYGMEAEQLEQLQEDYEEEIARRRKKGDIRDKWITPLLDFQSITEAFDPDQARTEDSMVEESLTNREESREAIAFAGRLIAIPLLAGTLIGRSLTDPVLSFVLANNPKAFALHEEQKVEAAHHVHMEEARVRMDMAIGRAPVLDERELMQHLREYAVETQEEEREANESHLMQAVTDALSIMIAAVVIARDSVGRNALANTFNRLFEGLSDIAKAVAIILITDTMLGYHSEEGWHGLLELGLGRYGMEGDEHLMVIFVGTIPVLIDVSFKYWIFVGLNKMSPGAVVTIKQIDTH